jgi:hypothetical protein
VALCTRTFQITGGTGRFKKASGGKITLTETVLAVLFDAASNPLFFAATGEMTVLPQFPCRFDRSNWP